MAGATGSASSLIGALRLVGSFFPAWLAPALEALSVVLSFIAGLGGLSVILGGLLARRGSPRFLCSLFVSLGAGVGLIGFLFHVAVLMSRSSGAVPYLSGFAASVAGAGSLLALIAQAKLLASGVE